MAKQPSEQLFLDRFLLVNKERYKDNPYVTNLLNSMTLDNTELYDVTRPVPGSPEISELSLNGPGLVGMEQRYERLNVNNPAVFDPPTIYPNIAAVRTLKVSGTYAYKDNDDNIAIVSMVDAGVLDKPDWNTVVLNQLNANFNYTINSTDVLPEYSSLAIMSFNGLAIFGSVTAEERLYDTQFALMTSAVLPNGYTATSKNTTSVNYQPWHVRDGILSYTGSDNSKRALWASGQNADNGGDWIDIGAPQPVSITGYRIYNRNDGISDVRSPKSWVLQGSNDGVEYMNLHRVDDDTNDAIGAVRSFNINRTVTYKHYRFMISAVNNGSSVIIQEIDFIYP